MYLYLVMLNVLNPSVKTCLINIVLRWLYSNLALDKSRLSFRSANVFLAIDLLTSPRQKVILTFIKLQLHIFKYMHTIHIKSTALIHTLKTCNRLPRNRLGKETHVLNSFESLNVTLPPLVKPPNPNWLCRRLSIQSFHLLN